MGVSWDYFNMQDYLPECGFVPAGFRLLLDPFCGNVSKVSSVQMTAATRLSCGGTLLNYTLALSPFTTFGKVPLASMEKIGSRQHYFRKLRFSPACCPVSFILDKFAMH